MWQERRAENGKLRLKMAHIQITDHLILGVLKHLLDSGELEARHFALEPQCQPGWNPVQSSLEDGSVDGALILAPIAMDLFGHGIPIQLVLLAHKNGSICVRSRKRTFSYPFEDGFRNTAFFIPHKMSVHHMLAHLFFRKIGLNPGMVGEGQSDVNFEVVAPVRMQEFLETQNHDSGFMVAEPLGTKAIAGGVADLQFLSSELWENHPCCVVALRRELIDTHPEAVQELVSFLVEAGRFIEKKPEWAAEIVVAFLDPKKTVV
jgi:ABC-type nitrate/sulfonate/bicarbonate transport system substrate-binding protein